MNSRRQSSPRAGGADSARGPRPEQPGETLRFHVLDGLAAFHGSRPLDLGAPRQRAVLATLLMNPRRVVPVDTIVHLLWGPTPPERAGATLQSYVSRLRKKLAGRAGRRGSGDRAGILRYQSPGYVLAVDDRQVDACHFETAVRTGQQLLAAGDFTAARRDFHEALGLCRGTPYCDLADYGFARDESSRLAETRIAAVEGHAEAGLALGLYGDVVAELGHHVRAHPLRERLVGRFMLALYHCGRQADALSVYERTRSRLADELGVDVGADLRAVHRAILRHEVAAVPVSPAPAPTPAAAAAAGPGSRGGDAEPFAGRAARLRRLDGLLRAARGGRGAIALLAGGPGTGKTRLLTEFGEAAAAQDIDVIRTGCLPGDELSPGRLWARLLRPLGTPPSGAPARDGSDPADTRFDGYEEVGRLADRLAAGRPLVILCEDLHHGDPDSLSLLRLLAAELHRAPLLLVATCQEFDAVPEAESHRRLGFLLREPRVRTIELGPLSRAEVRDLVAATPRTPHEPGPGADELYRRTGGNPFLVSRLLAHDGPADASPQDGAREDEVPPAVREFVRERLRSLGPEAAEALRTCALAEEGVPVGVLEAVLAAGGRTAGPPAEAVRSRLLRRHPSAPGVYECHPPLVREALRAEMGEVEAARLHGRLAYALLDAPPRDPGDTERIARHCREYVRVLGAADETVTRLLGAAVRAAGQPDYRRAELLLRLAAELAGEPRGGGCADELRLRVHRELACAVALSHGHGAAESRSAFDLSLRLHHRVRGADDPAVLLGLCGGDLVAGRYESARERAAALGALGERAGQLHVTGTLHGIRGELGTAVGALEGAVDLADSAAGRPGSPELSPLRYDPRVAYRCSAALTHWLLDDRAAAERRRDEALRLTDGTGRPADRAIALYAEALLAALDGDTDRARRAGSVGRALCEHHGLRHHLDLLTVCHAWAEVHRGHPAALEEFTGALHRLRASRTLLTLPLHLGMYAQALRRAGRTAEARAALAEMTARITAHGANVPTHRRLRFTSLAATPAVADAPVATGPPPAPPVNRPRRRPRSATTPCAGRRARPPGQETSKETPCP